MALALPPCLSAPVYYKGRPVFECANPYCGEEPGYGRWGLFCEHHAEQLAAIAEQFHTQGRNLSAGATDPRAKNRKRKLNRGPTCTFLGCAEPRVPPSAYCPVHEGEGYGDD